MNNYVIFYPEVGITQKKTLIPHWMYHMGKSIKDKEARKVYFDGLGDYFTDESPLFFAMGTGILNCNGKHKVQFSKCNE
jgi:hypothetical protein